MIEIRKLSLCFLLLLSSGAVYAQREVNFQLKTVLDTLEKRFKITFTYLDENIEGIIVSIPSEELDLDETLNFLSEISGLEFQLLNDRYVTIRKPKVIYINVCGYILNLESREPLSEATIQSKDKFAVSNSNGYFELSGIGKNTTLLIRSLGYQSQRVSAKDFHPDDCRFIYLHVEPTTLGEVIIPDYLSMGINKKLDGSFSLNTGNLGILPGLTEPDLMHSIQTLPGIQSIDETVSDINVRGGTNDQNLVLWNGVKMYQSGHFFGLISVFNPYLTKKVNLIKNGTGASLGDGVSSTISIETEDKVENEISGGGGFNMLHSDAFLKIPLSTKTAINVAARRSIGDLVQTPTYSQFFSRVFRDTDIFNSSLGADSLAATNQTFRFYDVNMSFIYDISNKNKLRINFLNIQNELEFQENAIINNITESKTSSLDQQSIAGNLSMSRLWNPKVRTTVFLYISKYNLNALNVNLFENQRLIQENEVLDLGLKFDSRITLSNNLDIFLGYQVSEVGITNLEDINNPDFRKRVKNVLINHAAFAEANLNSPDHNSNMKAGLRSVYIPEFGKFMIEPRLAFNQRIWEHFVFEVLGEMKSQTTTQIIDFQTDFLGVEKRRWVLSNNEDIPLIKSRQISLGVQYDRRNILASLEGYVKQVNGIHSLSQGFQNQFQFVKSTGIYDAHGVDILFSRKFKQISSWISYSYAKNTFEFPGLIPPSFPNNLDISHTTSAGASFQSGHWELSAGLNWHSGKPYTQPAISEPVINNKINFQLPNSSRLANYLRFDLSAVYNFQISNRLLSQFGISIWNILDHQNVINTYYILDDNNTVRLVERNALALTLNLMMRINF